MAHAIGTLVPVIGLLFSLLLIEIRGEHANRH
jgi:hypothetical protein